MNCRIELINPKDNKIVKSEILNDTYKICEERVSKRNEILKNKGSEKYWKVQTINC